MQKHNRILLTGATGFIGSHLLRNLVQENKDITILIRPTSSTWRINDVIDKCSVVKANLLDKKRLNSTLAFHTFDVVFHLAANTNHSQNQISLNTFNDNVLGTVNLFEYFLKNRPSVFINIGSCEEYGSTLTPFSENTRECPTSPYSASKVAVTQYGSMLHRVYNFPCITLRPFLTYGSMQGDDFLIPYTIIRCLKGLPIKTTKGEQTREFHYVADIVNGIILASKTPKAIGQIIDLGTGKEHKVGEVIKRIAELTHTKSSLQLGAIPYRKAELLRFYCKGEKAKVLLGWEPKTTLDMGLKKTIPWYKQNLNKYI